MLRGRVAFLFAIVLAGCSLFSDLGGFSEGASQTTDAGGVDEGSSDATAGDAAPSEGGPSTVDAGPDASKYTLEVLADKPIAYWPFDDAAGCVLVKEIVGGKNAGFSGTLGCGAEGISGTGISKTERDQVLEVGDYFDFAGEVPYSVEAWAKPSFEETEYPTIINKRPPGGTVGWDVYFHKRIDETEPGFQMEHTSPNGGNRTVFITTPDATARYHHVVVTFDRMVAMGAHLRLYYDGVRTDGFDDQILAADTTTPLWLLNGFKGLADEIALYDHALSVERVQAHHQAGKQ